MPSAILSFLKTRWILLLMLIVFVCFKISQLHYPFYLDEADVYAPAVKLMAEHGPSLLPGAIHSDFSRGHPLMFHFLCSIWLRCFGTSNIALHAFPLFVSVIFLIALFESCRGLFGEREATLALLLVATRVIFFVQSSFVYPEIMLAMFTFLSLYFYARDQLLLTSLMLFALFFTKEGGLIFGVIIGSDALVSLFTRKEPKLRGLLRLGAVLAPALLIALFFALQKSKEGWYILPEHSGLIVPDWKTYYFMFRRGLYWNFRGDRAMDALGLFTILLSLIPAWKYKNVRYLFLVPPVTIVYILAEIFASNATLAKMWMGLFVLCFAIPVYYLLQLNKTLSAPARRFLVLSGIGVVVFLLCSSLSQIGYRYLQAGIYLIMVFLAVCIVTFIEAGGKRLYYGAAAGILLIGAYGFYVNNRHEDTGLGAFEVMNVQLHEFSFLEKENAYDKEIACGCTFEKYRMTDTFEGFLSSKRLFTNIKLFPVGPTTEYALFGNSCRDEEEYQLMLTDTNFHSVFKMRDGNTWAEIFKRK
jgi:dolichyl-phosphate-mannose-protein mannosyltransferase